MTYEHKLNKIFFESAETDFYDVYAIISSNRIKEDEEIKALFIDKVSNLFDYFRSKIYEMLILRNSCIYSHNDPNQAKIFNKYMKVSNCKKQVETIKKLRSNEASYSGSWISIIDLFINMSFITDPYRQIQFLDRFFNMSHNNGPITDYMKSVGVHWLFDALYIKNLASLNELLARGSYDVRHAIRSASEGIGYVPVTNKQKYNLLNAKAERYGDDVFPIEDHWAD